MYRKGDRDEIKEEKKNEKETWKHGTNEVKKV
jgi:hypothetical protein